MDCKKCTLTNTGTTTAYFNYRKCDDLIWQYQNELLPGQTKHIWFLEGTFFTSYFGLSCSDDSEIFPPTPSCTRTPTPTTQVLVSPTPTNTETMTPTPTLTQTPTNTETTTPTPTNTETTTPTQTPTNTETLTPTPTLTQTPTPTTPPTTLTLTFDDITNADLLVGDSSSVTDWNTFFDLPTYGNPFTSVMVSGNTVILDGGSNITVRNNLFSPTTPNTFLTSIIDAAGSIVQVNNNAFAWNTSLTTISLPSVVTVEGYAFDITPNVTSIYMPELVTAGEQSFGSDIGYPYSGSNPVLTSLSLPKLETVDGYCFFGYRNVTTFDLPLLNTVGNSCFDSCESVVNFNLPSLTGAGNVCFSQCTGSTAFDLPNLVIAGGDCFQLCSSATEFNLPSLTGCGSGTFAYCTSATGFTLPSLINLGPTVGDNSVFSNITGNTIELTIPSALLTCDSGNPDGDIQYLQLNNFVIINGVQPEPLSLTFDNITNADILVGDSSNVNDWNTFFDLPSYGNPFYSVQITGNTVNLYNGGNVSIKNNLFEGINTLISVNDFAGSVTEIGQNSFYRYSGSVLNSVNFPEVTNIQQVAFGKDTSVTWTDSLTSINFPALQNISYDAFYTCDSLTTFIFPNVLTIAEWAFEDCKSMTTLYIPNCTDLGGSVGNNDVFHAWYGNTMTLTVPSSLMTCNGGGPDGDIQDLQANNTVNINIIPSPTTPPILTLTFDDITNADSLVGDSSSVSDWNTFFDLPTYGNPFTSVYVSGNTITLNGGSNIIIKEMLFDGPISAEGLISVDDTGCIIEIQYDAFGGDIYYGCPNLVSVSFLEVTILGGYCFGNCQSLINVNMPKLITAGNSFVGCTSLTSVYFPNLTATTGSFLSNCTSLVSISLPELIIGNDRIFQGCTSLNVVDLPKLVTLVGEFNFGYCTSLETLILPKLETTAPASFGNCSVLTSISLPLATTIAGGTFSSCFSLTNINLPSCIYLGPDCLINDNVFANITGNTITLTIPVALMTCKSGNPDEDIQILQSNNTVTIITV